MKCLRKRAKRNNAPVTLLCMVSKKAREFVTHLIGVFGLSTPYKRCRRVGKADPTKKRYTVESL